MSSKVFFLILLFMLMIFGLQLTIIGMIGLTSSSTTPKEVLIPICNNLEACQ